MFTTLKPSIIAAAAMAALAVTGVVAQERSGRQQPQAGMMEDGAMMPMMGMMQRMSAMMEACDGMMRAQMDQQERDAPPAQPQDDQ